MAVMAFTTSWSVTCRPEALGFVAQQRVVDELVERLAAQLEPLGQRGAPQQLLEAALQELRSDRRAGGG